MALLVAEQQVSLPTGLWKFCEIYLSEAMCGWLDRIIMDIYI